MKALLAIVLALSMSFPIIMASDYFELSCQVPQCGGVLIPTEQAKTTLTTLVQTYVNTQVLTLLKAKVLTEFLYSSMTTSSNQKCLSDDAFMRSTLILASLNPPMEASRFSLRSMYVQAKKTMWNLKRMTSSSGKQGLEKGSERMSYQECREFLPSPSEATCEPLVCSFYSDSTPSYIEAKYETCCYNMYGSNWPIYCG